MRTKKRKMWLVSKCCLISFTVDLTKLQSLPLFLVLRNQFNHFFNTASYRLCSFSMPSVILQAPTILLQPPTFCLTLVLPNLTLLLPSAIVLSMPWWIAQQMSIQQRMSLSWSKQSISLTMTKCSYQQQFVCPTASSWSQWSKCWHGQKICSTALLQEKTRQVGQVIWSAR